MNSPWSISLMTLIGAGILGYWLAQTAVPTQVPRQSNRPVTSADSEYVRDETLPKFRSGERKPSARSRDDEALAEGAFAGERIVIFSDAAAMADFLKRAGPQVKLLGQLDALNALRVGFSEDFDFSSLLDKNAQASLIYPVDVPLVPEGTAQDGAVPLGAGLLDWLGVEGDNSAWGSGVKIAILDTGVSLSPAFSNQISSINLVALPADLSTQNGHGTAVASMILGNNSLTPGVAPGASILSVRIANDLGESNSFILAKGIVAAVDAGARLINISMASQGDSGLVRNAIEYARSAGSMIIAAAGNNGLDRVSYPAANEGVVAVGAVDALGNHLDFSNTGKQIAISAPGFGVNAAWTGDQAASVSGTSFSSPIVVGAIAALMSQPGNQKLSNQQSLNLISAYLNDGGEAGNDSALGAGMPDLSRVMNRNTRGLHDAAVASQRIIPPDSANPYGQVEVMVQNRGTELLVNTLLQISTPSGIVSSNIATLPVNGVRMVRVPISSSTATRLNYDSRVSLANGIRDIKTANNRRVETYVPSFSK